MNIQAERDVLMREYTKLDNEALEATAQGNHTTARCLWAQMHIVGRDIDDLMEGAE